MKEYYVQYMKSDGAECLVVHPSFWKLVFWFLRTAQYCIHIVIFCEEEVNGKR